MAKVLPIVRIVDDDETFCMSQKMFLQAMGWLVLTYGSARAFLEDDDPEQPGCLILDMRMPEMTGLELQTALVSRGAPLPIIFLTGHGDVNMAVHALQHGAFVEVELHVAVQPQCAGQVGAGGQVDGVPRAAGVNGALQGSGIFGFAVALGPERGLGHINAVLDRRGAKFAAAHAPPGKKYISAVVCLAAQVSQGKVGAVTGGSGLAVQINGILRPGLGGCGLIPVQYGRMCGTACKNVRFKHAGSLSMMQNSVHTPLSLLLL